MKTIGILAGSGQFPFLVAKGARELGFKVAIAGFEDNTDLSIANECQAFKMFHLGQLGSIISFLKEENVSQLCMAGAISKPKALNFRPDFRAAKLFFRLAGNQGNNAILRIVSEEMQSEGIEVVQPETLVPSLIETPTGILSGPKPTKEMWEDIILGWNKAKILGEHDIGQCVSVTMGTIIAVEAIEGTDSLIERTGSLAKDTVLVKTFKPGQDERLDKPSIGNITIEKMAENNFKCLVFEAGKVLFFDLENSIKLANKKGITIVAVPSDSSEAFFSDNIR